MNNLLCVRNKEVYFYPVEENCLYPIENNLLSRAFLKLCHVSKKAIPDLFIKEEVYNFDKIIITDSAFTISLYKALIKKKRKKDLVLYYMNNIDKTNEYMMDYFEEIYSFDLEDAQKYSIHFKHTPYSKNIKYHQAEITYDTLFLGRAKDRIEEIIRLKDFLDSKQLKNKFLVLDADRKDIKLNAFLSYEKYLDLVARSKCLIEINKKNQAGCSLRFMEAIFLKKKLITNNIFVSNDLYFDKNNVYILGHDNRDIINFINSPYVDNNINLDELTFTNWIKGF